MLAVKAVELSYQPSENIHELLETFKDMVNHCICVGLKRNITSRFRLSNEVYYELTKNGLHSWYSLSAIEIATSILKNYRKSKRKNENIKIPKVERLMAKLGNQAYKVVGNELRIPIKPKEYFYVKLHKRASEFLSNSTLRPGSITLTASKVVLTFVKTAEVIEPRGYVAIDVNEDNITAVSTDGEVKVYDLSKLKEASYGYFWRRRKLQQKYCRDRRILKKALSKLSKNYNTKVCATLHKTSVGIVKSCKTKGFGLIHESLKNVRNNINWKVKRFNGFNGKVQYTSKHPKELKRRLNNWWFRKFLIQICYKSGWEEIKAIESEHTKGSSSTCPICRSKLAKYLNGQVKCKKCGYEGNRHVVACLNLLKWELAVQARTPRKCSDEPSPNEPKAMRKSLESKSVEVALTSICNINLVNATEP